MLGSRVSLVDSFSPLGGGTAPPVRIFGVRRFAIDRDEVTVGRYRAALARGLVAGLPAVNDGALDPQNDSTCTWSSKPMGREELPVVCIDWTASREFCRFEGGDLPTETEWEHAATVAGFAQKQLYPWGSEMVGCADAVFGRDPKLSAAGGQCKSEGVVPVPVTEGPRDVTVLGIHGLAGGAREWTRDVFAPYQAPCWAEAPIESPMCRTSGGTVGHTHRGLSWLAPLAPLASRVASRESKGMARDVGFRCAYELPARAGQDR